MARVQLKSGPSRRACYLRFMNKSRRKVNVIWVDYAGQHQNYGTLDPKRHFDIHTYEGHPWVCEDSSSKMKSRMLLNKEEVYHPMAPRDEPHERRYSLTLESDFRIYLRDESQRQSVDITMPVYSLQELSAEVILQNVQPTDIQRLEIPKMLQDMLLAQQSTTQGQNV